MAFKNLITFGAGELTPDLWERGNLDKFRTGLARLRNAIVTKFGGLISRAGTRFLFETENNNAAKFLYIQSKNYLLEFTARNIKVRTGFNVSDYSFVSSADVNMSLFPVMDSVEDLHFTHGNKYLFLFRKGCEIARVDLDKIFSNPTNAVSFLRDHIKPYSPSVWYTNPPTTVVYAAGSVAPTGYDIDYAITFVYDDIETFYNYLNQSLKKPVKTGEYNAVTVTITKASLAGNPFPDEVRVYQRPRNGGSFFFVGNAYPVETSTTVTYSFRDAGVQLIFTDQPPEYVKLFETDTKTSIIDPGVYIYPPQSKTGLIYQDRLIFSGTRQDNRVFGSRTGSTAMTRDYPLQDDSAVAFKLGSDGGLEVQRFFDGRGLLIFTTVGVYETPANLLVPETAYAIKRGPYVATDKMEPIQLGGYVTIYDMRLRAVIGLTPSGNDQGYTYSEFSIFSRHLFKGKKPVSWALEDADTQVLWIVFDDGSVASFSFQDEQLLRSWARHDFKSGKAEEVFVMKVPNGRDVVCFLVNRNGVRSVEAMTDREANFKEFIGTDATVFYKSNLLSEITAAYATVEPVVEDDWEGQLTITPESFGFENDPGDVVRFYTSEFEYIDMEVVDNDGGILTVQPESEFPSDKATITIEQGLWRTFTELDGLDHLEGQKVSVRLDGFTHASPLNTEEDYEEFTVVDGKITLADDDRGSFISVGLPIVTDIKTLEVDTVNQSPTKLEGQIVNRLWLSYLDSLFLYAGSELPEDDTVTGMDNQCFQVEPDEGISNNIPPLPQSERLEMIIQGDWKVNGSVSLRNVDPQPIGLRAIIPDIEVIGN